jgi:hypothetical protein
MKKYITLLTVAIILFLSTGFTYPAQNPQPQAGSFTPVTGWDMMQRMGLGINIGNTLDAVGAIGERQGLESETLWGAPRIEKWQFEAIAQKGFDSVRIPVTWGNHMDATTRQIDKEWMDRVQECVDYALEAGLVVIINTHHEHSLYQYMVCDAEGQYGDFYNAAKWLDDVWGQIAKRFKDYPETLLFEPMNEPNPAGWYWDPIGHARQRARLSTLTNQLNRHVLETIRNSGGNNDRRIIVNAITQADAKLIDQYEHTFNDPYTMLGVFFYTNDEQIQFNQIKTAMQQGIPIILKETMPIEINDAVKALEWANTWYPQLSALGAVPMWWNCYGQPPGELFDRWSGRWVAPMVDALFSAYDKTPGTDMPPPPGARNYFDVGGYDEGNGIYWFGSLKLRDAMTEYKYLLVELDTDDVNFVIHSGANGYTRIEVKGQRIEGTDWWYIETAEPIKHHLGTLEQIGWWFQVQLFCALKTDNGIPRAALSGELLSFYSKPHPVYPVSMFIIADGGESLAYPVHLISQSPSLRVYVNRVFRLGRALYLYDAETKKWHEISKNATVDNMRVVALPEFHYELFTPASPSIP